MKSNIEKVFHLVKACIPAIEMRRLPKGLGDSDILEFRLLSRDQKTCKASIVERRYSIEILGGRGLQSKIIEHKAFEVVSELCRDIITKESKIL